MHRVGTHSCIASIFAVAGCVVRGRRWSTRRSAVAHLVPIDAQVFVAHCGVLPNRRPCISRNRRAAEFPFEETGRRLPNGNWQMPVDAEPWKRLQKVRLHGESISDCIIRVIIITLHQRGLLWKQRYN